MTTKIAIVLLIAYFAGNLLIFTTPPVQICIGWPDDDVASYICTPDYTVAP